MRGPPCRCGKGRGYFSLQQVILQAFVDRSLDGVANVTVGCVWGRGAGSGSGGERLSLVLVVVHAERDRLTGRVQRPVHGNGENVLDDVLDDLLAANGALVCEIHRTILRRHHQLLLLLQYQA